MAFKSQAHREKLAQLVKEGMMKQSTFDEFEANTKGSLPARVTPDKRPKTISELRDIAKKKLNK